MIYGKVKSITIDAKVRQIVDSESHKVTNNIGALARGIKVFIHKKNKVFGAENGFVYLKKTGELLYYTNKSKDPVLPKSIKKITKKTYWCTSYINKFTLSKNVKYVNGNYLPVREGYLRKFYIPGKNKVKFVNCDAIDLQSKVIVYVNRHLKSYYKKVFRKCKNVKVRIG